MFINGELIIIECSVTLLKPITNNKEEKEFRDWIKEFNPFYFIFIGGDGVLIGW